MSAEDPDRIGSTWLTTKATSWPPRRWCGWHPRLVLVRRVVTAKREVRGSNAVQWQMIRDALAAAPRSTTCGDHRHPGRSTPTSA